MSDPYEDWDASYVLGALSPAERREFESHLRTCERCSSSVAELGAMPALLARVPREEAFALLGSTSRGPEPVPDPLPRLVAAVHASRRRRRLWTSAAVLAAAAALVAVLALPGALARSPHALAVPLTAVAETIPLAAEVEVVPESWGTRLDMTCRYRSGTLPDTPPPWSYELAVTDRSGARTVVSSWEAGPGQTVHTTGTVDLDADQIASLEVLASASGTVLLSADVPARSG
ncbi:anti-sigma factor family protein [Naasia aerilata]|uniref:Anti-sigma-L factor RslA n=1 Tax=Naasia aerilata TaxID=1162966 RepID=A0ABN6XLH2_9MICO|nr:zf-HC2 domain-containing protein [Naasia aerilata]BDZ45807.1 anti-sigma-L factor RslA [Naasia aerilata]